MTNDSRHAELLSEYARLMNRAFALEQEADAARRRATELEAEAERLGREATVVRSDQHECRRRIIQSGYPDVYPYAGTVFDPWLKRG